MALSQASAVSEEVSDELAEIRQLLKSSAQLQAERAKSQSDKKPSDEKEKILKSDVKLIPFRLNDVGQRAIDLHNWLTDSRLTISPILDSSTQCWDGLVKTAQTACDKCLSSSPLDRLTVEPKITTKEEWSRVKCILGL